MWVPLRLPAFFVPTFIGVLLPFLALCACGLLQQKRPRRGLRILQRSSCKNLEEPRTVQRCRGSLWTHDADVRYSVRNCGLAKLLFVYTGTQYRVLKICGKLVQRNSEAKSCSPPQLMRAIENSKPYTLNPKPEALNQKR